MFSVQQAFLRRDERRVPLKASVWEAIVTLKHSKLLMHVKRSFVLYLRVIPKYKLLWVYVWRGNFMEGCFLAVIYLKAGLYC